MTKFNLQQPASPFRDLRILLKYIRLNFLSAVEYKLGFVTIITTVVLNALIWLVYWRVILDTTDGTFGNWTASELIVWYFFTEFSIGLFGLFTGISQAYHYIIEDGLETLLVKPFHPLIQIMGDQMYVLALLRSAISIVILVVGLIVFNITISPVLLLMGIILSICGILIFNSIYILVQTLAFWIGNVEFLVEAQVDVEMNFIRLPQHIIPNYILFSVFIIIPVGLFSTIPTLLIFNQGLFSSINILGESLILLMVIVFTLLNILGSFRFFNFGLRRYEGVGE